MVTKYQLFLIPHSARIELCNIRNPMMTTNIGDLPMQQRCATSITGGTRRE